MSEYIRKHFVELLAAKRHQISCQPSGSDTQLLVTIEKGVAKHTVRLGLGDDVMDILHAYEIGFDLILEDYVALLQKEMN